MGQLGSEAVIIQAAHATAPARSSWQTPKARRGRAVKRARTDSDRTITYDPANRPEVANLLLLCSLCSGRTPEEIAGEIGDGGAGRLKQLLIESLNDYLRPLRSRRRELEKEPEYYDMVRSLAQQLKIPVLFGAVTSRNDLYYNSCLMVSSSGEMVDRYDKLHLVPFGWQ